MKNSIHGTLIAYDRRNSSVNGNPAYSLLIEIDGEQEWYKSSSDSAFCYEVTNHRTPCKVEFTLTQAGRINYMKWSK
jgi:hypothetical protein